MSAIDLIALQKYLKQLGSPLTLTAADAKLGPELTSWLESLPGRQVSLTVPGGGIAGDATRLTVTGTTAETWTIDGLAAPAAKVSDFTLTIVDGSPSPAITGVAHGTLDLGAQIPSGVVLTSQKQVTADPSHPSDPATVYPWLLELTADVDGITTEGLAGLALPGELPFVVPKELDVITKDLTVEKTDFAITFHPNTTYEASLRATVADKAFSWPVIKGAVLIDGVEVQVDAMTRSLTITLVSDLEIGHVPVELGIQFGTTPVWQAFARAPEGKQLPGIVAIADWIAAPGHSQGSEITAGMGGMKGVDAGKFDERIIGVSITFDAHAAQLIRLEVDSELIVAGIPLLVRLLLPDLTLIGGLKPGEPPTKVSGVLSSVGLPTEHLPSDAVIVRADFNARPAHTAYGASFEVDDVAKAGPFTLERLAAGVSYTAGGFGGTFDAVLKLWDVGEIELRADYDPAKGWAFLGGTPSGTELAVDTIIEKIGEEFKFSVKNTPQPLKTLSIHGLQVGYETGTGNFEFTCIGDFNVYDKSVEITPSVKVSPVDPADPTKGYRYEFGGRLNIAGVELDLGYASQPASSTFVGSLDSNDGPISIDLARLIGELSSTLGSLVPAGLSVGLKYVKLASISGTRRKLAVAIDLSASISLSDLPLIGSKIRGAETVALSDLQISYASAQMTSDDVNTINPLLPEKIRFPETGLPEGATVVAQIDLAGQKETLELSLGGGGKGNQPVPRQHALSRAVGAPGPPSAPPAAPTAKWWDVGKQLGVVRFERFGVIYDGGALFIAIDGAVTLGPLGLSLQGLGIGSPLSAFEPEFRLSGVGISFTEPPLEIAGAVLRVEPPPARTKYQFDGSLVISAEAFTLAAIGSYAVLDDGEPSLFVFAQLERPLGGPPAFFVTGLMAGFGFNRALAIPAQDEVLGFPLLTLNQPKKPGETPATQGLSDVLKVMEGQVAGPDGKTKPWIAPKPGSYWLAVGVEFLSFELVSTRAVLIGELGDELVFALLGLSSMTLPQSADSLNPYAYVELELEAVLKPREGVFGLTAILSPNSYVITPTCHLTGGFAFFVWFAPNDNAGQFVVTLGGYHPAFKPPPFFPQVPRLGFNWAVSDKLSIGGNAYFALTASAVMAGGRLEALFHMGDLRASFAAGADLLMSWRPFFYTARIFVEVDVSYRLNLLGCHKTIDLSLSAEVRMSGPPTGGSARVHLWCVSFTVEFGSTGTDKGNDPLKWPQFASLLPANDQAVRLQPGGGLYKTVNDTPAVKVPGARALAPGGSSSGKKWYVRATGFTFTTESPVPASHLAYGERPADDPTAGTLDKAAPLNIRPMNATGLTSVHRLIVRQGSPTANPANVTDWTLDASTRAVPKALWGAPPSPFTHTPSASAETIREQITGFQIKAPSPELGHTRGVFALGELALAYLEPSGAIPPLATEKPSTDYVPRPKPTSIGDITEIAAAGGDRTALLKALGPVFTSRDGDMSKMAAGAEHLFADAPLEVAT